MSLALDKKIQDGEREKREREKLINGRTNQISWGEGKLPESNATDPLHDCNEYLNIDIVKPSKLKITCYPTDPLHAIVINISTLPLLTC